MNPPQANPRARSKWLYFKRGMRLVCPECGISPIFAPFTRTRSTWDWFTPLDGCPRCGYAYQRESGYFLLATWGVNYGVVAGLGTFFAFLVDTLWHPPLWKTIALVIAPMPLLSLLFARHAKSLYLALDHYCDPHVKP